MSDAQTRIKEIVTGHPVVLFMKGTAQFPQCGFSGNAINILRACGVETLHTVNVFDDEAIRQGLKSMPTGRPFLSFMSMESSSADLTS